MLYDQNSTTKLWLWIKGRSELLQITLTTWVFCVCTELFTQTEHANKLSSAEVCTILFKAYHKYLYPIICPGQNYVLTMLLITSASVVTALF